MTSELEDSPSEASPVGQLRLVVRCSDTKPGQAIAVAGEGAALRDWGRSPDGPLLLECVEQQPGGGEVVSWPTWTLRTPLEVQVGERLEYKYILFSEDKQRVVRWETSGVGENRRLLVDDSLLETGVRDDGEYGQLSEGGRLVEAPPGEDARDRRGDREDRASAREAREVERRERKARDGADADGDADAGWPPLPPYRKLRRIGKGKQGKCFLVSLEDGTDARALVKELKGGGRHAFRAEVDSLLALSGSRAAASGAVPRFLGAASKSRQVMMSFFAGATLPDLDLVPVLSAGASLAAIAGALQCWLDVAGAVQEANELGLVHCDVNPWNVLIKGMGAAPRDSDEDAASSPLSSSNGGAAADDGAGCAACLVDWACASHPGDNVRGLPFKKRGDFQPAELLNGKVGSCTDAFGCTATLLWLLTRRTRKGVSDELASGPPSLERYFAGALGTRSDVPAEALAPLAAACCAGLNEDHSARAPLPTICEAVRRALHVLSEKCGVSVAGAQADVT